MAQAKAEGIVYKFINDLHPSSAWEAVNKGIFQVYNPVATKVHAATVI